LAPAISVDDEIATLYEELDDDAPREN